MKKPLTPCQLCRRELVACRELLAKEQERCATAEALLREAQSALGEGAAALRDGAATVRRNALANGAQPSWLVKDFNVLYRVATQYLERTTHLDQRFDAEQADSRDLRAQLERLKPAFTDTEEVRRLMRERQG